MARVVVRTVSVLLVTVLVPCAATAADRWTIGLTTTGAAIDALVVPGASRSPTVLLLGGVQKRDQSSDAVAREVAAYEARPQPRRPFRMLAIPIVNPDAQPLQFPPAGAAYRENIESHVLWRWIGVHGPDLVLIAGPDSGLAEALSQNAVGEIGRIPARRIEVSTTISRAPTPWR